MYFLIHFSFNWVQKIVLKYTWLLKLYEWLMKWVIEIQSERVEVSVRDTERQREREREREREWQTVQLYCLLCVDTFAGALRTSSWQWEAMSPIQSNVNWSWSILLECVRPPTYLLLSTLVGSHAYSCLLLSSPVYSCLLMSVVMSVIEWWRCRASENWFEFWQSNLLEILVSSCFVRFAGSSFCCIGL